MFGSVILFKKIFSVPKLFRISKSNKDLKLKKKPHKKTIKKTFMNKMKFKKKILQIRNLLLISKN